MVAVPPPPRKTGTRLSAEFVTGLGVDRPADNMSKRDRQILQDLNFKVPPELHRDFKLIATELGLSMRDLLEHILDDYCRTHGPQTREIAPTVTRRGERLRDPKR